LADVVWPLVSVVVASVLPDFAVEEWLFKAASAASISAGLRPSFFSAATTAVRDDVLLEEELSVVSDGD
jgi:hypothetical protein